MTVGSHHGCSITRPPRGETATAVPAELQELRRRVRRLRAIVDDPKLAQP